MRVIAFYLSPGLLVLQEFYPRIYAALDSISFAKSNLNPNRSAFCTYCRSFFLMQQKHRSANKKPVNMID
jgi:hypothetical protein